MSRFFLYLLIILILALITFVLREKLGKKTKPFFGVLLVIFIVLAVFFEFENTQKSHLRTDIIVETGFTNFVLRYLAKIAECE